MSLIFNHLSINETSDFLEGIKSNKRFNNVVREMKNYTPFDETAFEAEDALQFDVLYNEDVIIGKAATLKFTPDASLIVIDRYDNGDTTTLNKLFLGTVVINNPDGSKQYLYFKTNDDNYVRINEDLVSAEKAQALEAQATKEDAPVDEEYYPGKLLDQIESQGFLDGCLPGGYIWCGGKCGGGSASCSSTSTKPVNALDSCCKKHDCCYYNYDEEFPHCLCDARLCSCAQQNATTSAKYAVTAVMCWCGTSAG